MKVVVVLAHFSLIQLFRAVSEYSDVSEQITKKQALQILIDKRNSNKGNLQVLTTNRRNLEEDTANPVETRQAAPSSLRQQRAWFARSTLNEDCDKHKCDLEEIFEHVGSKSEARKKLKRYQNQCRFSPCTKGSTTHCIQLWNKRECKCDEFSHGETCEQDVNECLEDGICGATGICRNLRNKPGYNCECPNGQKFDSQEKQCKSVNSSRRSDLSQGNSTSSTFLSASTDNPFTETAAGTYAPKEIGRVTEVIPCNHFFCFSNNMKYTGIMKFDVTLKEDCPKHYTADYADGYKYAYSVILRDTLGDEMKAEKTVFPVMFCDNTGIEPKFRFKVWYYFGTDSKVREMNSEVIERMAQIYKEQIVEVSPEEILIFEFGDIEIKHEWCDECA